jgi:hypothetical protein
LEARMSEYLEKHPFFWALARFRDGPPGDFVGG